MPAAARILDANFNRAREALRVMEDAARFALDDAALSEQLKTLRHELRQIADDIAPPGVLVANRNTPGDVGVEITTASEMNRNNLLDVVVAAGKRLTESLRVIEEMCKIEFNAIAARIETLRYRAYEIDKQLQLRFGSGRAQQWRLCLVLTIGLCRKPWREVVRESVAAGVACVQVREKHMHGKELMQHVREVISVAKLRAAVIVNDRVDVAMAAGADGVHLGQEDVSVADVRRIAGRSLIVGASAHTMEEARAAVNAGADYCGVGTMFATAIKPDLTITGPKFLKAFVEQFPNVPHLAIGGVTPANMHLLIEAAVQGVAVSSAICTADDPGAAAAQIIAKITTRTSDEAVGAAQISHTQR